MRWYLQSQLPLAAALKGRDEGGVGDDIWGARLLLHQVDEVPGLLPLTACTSQYVVLQSIMCTTCDIVTTSHISEIGMGHH